MRYRSGISVLAALALLVLARAAPAQMSEEQMAMVRHAHPMPNLMRVVQEHEEELGLSKAQKEALAAWRERMQPRMMEMVRGVMRLEKEIHDAALAGAPGDVLQDLATQLFNLRGAILRQKLACRNHLYRVLGPERMRKVIERYRKARREGEAAGA